MAINHHGSVQISDKEFKKLSQLIYKHSGIRLKDTKKGLVRSRLRSRLQELELNSFEEYIDRVFKDQTGQELSRLMEAISTNVTSFFREADHFEFLRREVLPDIEKKFKQRHNTYCHFWSAACSTGQEPYTLAITLQEAINKISFYDVKVLGTDISEQAVRTARRGVYPPKAVDGVNDVIVRRYFDYFTTPAGERKIRVKPALKKMTRFGILNLNRSEAFPFSKKFDVIFCRNVLIYFDNPVVERLMKKFYRYLKPGGYLFVGHSESLTRVNHPFDYVKATIYCKS